MKEEGKGGRRGGGREEARDHFPIETCPKLGHILRSSPVGHRRGGVPTPVPPPSVALDARAVALGTPRDHSPLSRSARTFSFL